MTLFFDSQELKTFSERVHLGNPSFGAPNFESPSFSFWNFQVDADQFIQRVLFCFLSHVRRLHWEISCFQVMYFGTLCRL